MLSRPSLIGWPRLRELAFELPPNHWQLDQNASIKRMPYFVRACPVFEIHPLFAEIMLQSLLKIIVLPMVDLKALLHGTARADQLDSSDDGNQSAGGYGTRAQPGFSPTAQDIQESE